MKYTGLEEVINRKWPGTQKISWVDTKYSPGVGEAKFLGFHWVCYRLRRLKGFSSLYSLDRN